MLAIDVSAVEQPLFGSTGPAVPTGLGARAKRKWVTPIADAGLVLQSLSPWDLREERSDGTWPSKSGDWLNQTLQVQSKPHRPVGRQATDW